MNEEKSLSSRLFALSSNFSANHTTLPLSTFIVTGYSFLYFSEWASERWFCIFNTNLVSLFRLLSDGLLLSSYPTVLTHPSCLPLHVSFTLLSSFPCPFTLSSHTSNKPSMTEQIWLDASITTLHCPPACTMYDYGSESMWYNTSVTACWLINATKAPLKNQHLFHACKSNLNLQHRGMQISHCLACNNATVNNVYACAFMPAQNVQLPKH